MDKGSDIEKAVFKSWIRHIILTKWRLEKKF